MKLGRLKIDAVSDGVFRLDGGAMFGIVPQTLWKKRMPPDDLNRILLGLNVLLIDDGKEVSIIDTGVGTKIGGKFSERYGIERKNTLLEGLLEKGYKPGDIDRVILTHLHFDHAGGATLADEKGRPIPAFPSAKYSVQKAEWEDALTPNEVTRASYLEENFVPLERSGQLEILEGNSRLSREVRVELTGGHTRGHQVVYIESEGESLVHMGDIVPTSYHLPLPYIMGYDTFPLTTLDIRKEIYGKAVDQHWRLFFEHDPHPRAAMLVEKDGKITIDEKSLFRFGDAS
jgi:glyoxylase-like metal-dependent hydrolase (beta-lactamase superfamily II)